MITRPIGEKFTDHYGIELIVVKSANDSCKGCIYDEPGGCNSRPDITGWCGISTRTDHQETIFKQTEPNE
jgi:hypothetical protein